MPRGNILTVRLPPPAGNPGHEQIGNRPAIAVQNDTTNHSTTMIVPLTSNLQALRFTHTFQVDPSPENGLAMSSVILVFQLRAIDNRRLGNVIGQLEDYHLQRLEAEIRDLLDL
jgi:mRNA interferase MazF